MSKLVYLSIPLVLIALGLSLGFISRRRNLVQRRVTKEQLKCLELIKDGKIEASLNEKLGDASQQELSRAIRETAKGLQQHFLKLNAEILRLAELNNNLEQQVNDKDLELQIAQAGLCDMGDQVRSVAKDVKMARERLVDTEDRYSNASRELAQLNSDLNDFARLSYRDLQKPLHGIKAATHYIRQSYHHLLDEAGIGQLENIDSFVKRSEKLVDALFDFYRWGRTPVLRLDSNIEHTILSVLNANKERFEQEGAEVSLQENLPNLACDKQIVSFVFRHLISNAIAYNDAKSKKIEIGFLQANQGSKVEQLANDSEQQIFFVKDNGIGIAKKDVPAAFEMFKRLNGRLKYGTGSGAGLAVTRKLLERHGGAIWIDSNIGEGSTFYFTLGSAIEDESRGMSRERKIVGT